jgi:hypothetical protein
MVKFSLKNLMIFITLIAVVSGFTKILFESEVSIAAISAALLTPIFIHAINKKAVIVTLFSYTMYITCIVRLNYEVWRTVDQWIQ